MEAPGRRVNGLNDRYLIFAYDPGLVTGWACLEPATAAFANGQTNGRHEFERQFEQTIATGGTVEVVGEKFTITARTTKLTQQVDAMFINGYVDGLAAKLGFRFTLQTPAQAKSFATDDKLKALGWHRPTPGGHANDATRHLLTYVATNQRILAGKPLLDKIVEVLGL